MFIQPPILNPDTGLKMYAKNKKININFLSSITPQNVFCINVGSPRPCNTILRLMVDVFTDQMEYKSSKL